MLLVFVKGDVFTGLAVPPMARHIDSQTYSRYIQNSIQSVTKYFASVDCFS